VESKKSITTSKFSGKGARLFNDDLLIFAFFLLLSFIFWYLNSLRKEIEVDLNYPVKYVNIPRERTLGGKMPNKLLFNLKGPGYSIIKLKISGNRAPVLIDFSNVTWKKVPGTGDPEYFILSNGLIPNFSRQLRSEFQIISVKPDTLFFTLNNKVPSGQGSKADVGGKK
jgi:hypothetical protein